MFDPPITTQGSILKAIKDHIYQVALPNGKTVIGHVPKSQRDIHTSLQTNVIVLLELTPYDLEKARIVGLANADD